MPQSESPAQLAQIPPKPSCIPNALFSSATCNGLWRNYNQAVQQRTREELQLYVNRQKELASSQATAPPQQQIADLNKLVSDQQNQIMKMQEQMQADAASALQAAAHSEGLQYGTEIGVSASLVLFVILYGIKRVMSRFTVARKPQAGGAAAGM